MMTQLIYDIYIKGPLCSIEPPECSSLSPTTSKHRLEHTVLSCTYIHTAYVNTRFPAPANNDPSYFFFLVLISFLLSFFWCSIPNSCCHMLKREVRKAFPSGLYVLGYCRALTRQLCERYKGLILSLHKQSDL